jgi:hypothetical protein
MKAKCEVHDDREGVEVRCVGVRGFRIVACGECRERMVREGFEVVEVKAK